MGITLGAGAALLHLLWKTCVASVFLPAPTGMREVAASHYPPPPPQDRHIPAQLQGKVRRYFEQVWAPHAGEFRGRLSLGVENEEGRGARAGMAALEPVRGLTPFVPAAAWRLQRRHRGRLVL